MNAEDVIPAYTAAARDWSAARSRTLFERRWLDRFYSAAPRGPGGVELLDLGCGTGLPLARYLAERGARVTGLDPVPWMIAAFEENLPGARSILGDMRNAEIAQRFDGILAWDSLFHLNARDQRAMFPRLASLLHPGGALMFTSGPAPGTALGRIGDREVFHESLAPEDYRAALVDAGFRVIDMVAEDPTCGGHTVWLSRLTGG